MPTKKTLYVCIILYNIYGTRIRTKKKLINKFYKHFKHNLPNTIRYLFSIY